MILAHRWLLLASFSTGACEKLETVSVKRSNIFDRFSKIAARSGLVIFFEAVLATLLTLPSSSVAGIISCRFAFDFAAAAGAEVVRVGAADVGAAVSGRDRAEVLTSDRADVLAGCGEGGTRSTSS